MTRLKIQGVSLDVDMSGHIQLSDYCIGDGSIQTAKLQEALDAGKLQNRIVNGGNLTVGIDGPLTMDGPGLVFDRVGYAPGIVVHGNGYTALTVQEGNRVSQFQVMLHGSDNECNGIYFNNCVVSSIQNIRVQKLNGFGVRLDNVWDTYIGTISIEQCGNDSNPAFSMNDGADTCNMTTIGRLQVERATGKAIHVSPNSLCCTINNIHSEQASGDAPWQIGGTRCTYSNVRFHPSTPGAKLHIVGANCTITNLLAETSAEVVWDSYNGANNTLVCPEVSGVMTEMAGQYGTMTILGGRIENWGGSLRNLRRYGMYGTSNVPFTPSLAFGGANVGGDYGVQLGEYSIVGDRVVGNLTIGMRSKGSSTGLAAILGLPFVRRPGGPDSTSPIAFERVVCPGSPIGLLVGDSSAFSLFSFPNDGAAAVQLTEAAFANNATIRLAFDFPVG
jgi:hypothetical protein